MERTMDGMNGDMDTPSGEMGSSDAQDRGEQRSRPARTTRPKATKRKAKAKARPKARPKAKARRKPAKRAAARPAKRATKGKAKGRGRGKATKAKRGGRRR